MDKYPDFNIIEKEFIQAISGILQEKQQEYADNNSFFTPYCQIQCWPQVFPNTAGIFSAPNMISGAAMTEQYISVIYEHVTGIYGVFGGNNLAYIVTTEPTRYFFEDVNARCMETVGKIAGKYFH